MERTPTLGVILKTNEKLIENCILLYCPCSSSIHEKANGIAICWTGCPHRLGLAISQVSGQSVFNIKVGASR